MSLSFELHCYHWQYSAMNVIAAIKDVTVSTKELDTQG